MDVRMLDSEERLGFDHHRAWFDDLLEGGGSDIRLTGGREDLPTLQSIFDQGPYTDQPMGELNAFGTAFWEVLSSALDMEWVVVTDEHGVDFALRHAMKSVFLFPHDSLLKRVENGDHINFTQLFDDLASEVRNQLGLDVGIHSEP